MPNALLTISHGHYERFLDCCQNNLVFCQGIERKYSEEFAIPGSP